MYPNFSLPYGNKPHTCISVIENKKMNQIKLDNSSAEVKNKKSRSNISKLNNVREQKSDLKDIIMKNIQLEH